MPHYCLCSNVNLFLSLKVLLSSVPVFKQHINKLDFNVEEYYIYSDKKARDTPEAFLEWVSDYSQYWEYLHSFRLLEKKICNIG